MLMQTNDVAVRQLLEDLLAVRSMLRTNWVKGAFQRNGNLCTVAAVNTVCGLPHVATWTTVPADCTDPRYVRAGRLILQLYTTVYGPDAPTDITVSEAAARIASFNDHGEVTLDVVLLALDRAVTELMS